MSRSRRRNGYVFAAREDDKFIGEYGHTPVVVRKADGSLTGMPEFIDEGRGEEIRAFDIKS